MNDTLWSHHSVTLSSPKCLSPSVTASGSNLGFIFASEMFELVKDSGPLFQTHALVIEAQVSISEKESVVGFVTDMTFGFGKSAGTRIAVLADVAGTQSSFELRFDAPGTEDSLKSMQIRRTFSVLGLRNAGGGSTGVVGPKVPFHVALLFTIQRENLQEHGSFGIDAIDVFPVIRSL